MPKKPKVKKIKQVIWANLWKGGIIFGVELDDKNQMVCEITNEQLNSMSRINHSLSFPPVAPTE